MSKDIDEFKEETKSEAVDEVVHKMETEPEFAETVAGALVEHEGVRSKLLDDERLAGKLTKHLLSDDGGLMDKVRTELEADGLRLESGKTEQEYTDKQAAQDFEILCKSVKHKEDPSTIAKECGVEVSKTLQETDWSNAGLLIEERMLNEIIPILTSSATFVDAGAQRIEMQNTNKVGIGRQNQDPTATRQNEDTTISTSDTDFDKLQLDGKKLTTLMEVSNDILRRDAIITANDFLASRMMTSARNKLEQAIFRGSGGQFQPSGLLNEVDSAHVNSSSGNSITNVVDDFREAVQLLEGEDVPDDQRAWFMRRDVYVDFVFDISSTEDTFPFRDELVENGTMLGDSVMTTNNIEKRTDDSNIYYAEMSEQYVGIGTDFELSTSEHANFATDETVLKQIGHFDYKMKHDKSAAVVEDYTLQSA